MLFLCWLLYFIYIPGHKFGCLFIFGIFSSVKNRENYRVCDANKLQTSDKMKISTIDYSVYKFRLTFSYCVGLFSTS